MKRVDLTHKGWFGVCPSYFGDVESDGPVVVERHWVFTPLMWLSECVFSLCFLCMDTLGKEVDGWSMVFTGELEQGRFTIDIDQ